jgi:lipopolysaccharide transport system ATP-binding protein
MGELAIRVEGLGKRYRIGAGRPRYRTLRDSVWDVASSPLRGLRSVLRGGSPDGRAVGTFWALKGVSFEVHPGEVVGIIGRNGAGKSTLLKVLAQITEPTEGLADIHGRVGSLLEVGTGFHGELTGRENVYLNGAILGMKRAEIARKFDEIVAFAEVERFIDTPVKHYSSGMHMRLAFAVAAHLEPQILIVDEVLAVGDAAFQERCLNKMGQVGRAGRTVLFVSHNMYAVSRLTRRALLVEAGRVVADGETSAVVKKYLATGGDLQAEWVRPAGQGSPSDVQITAVRCRNATGDVTARLDAAEPFVIEIDFTVRCRTEAQIAFRFNSGSDGGTVFTSALSDPEHARATPFEAGKCRARCQIPAPFLVPGNYHLLVAANNPRGPQFDLLEHVLELEISEVGSLTRLAGRLGHVAPLLQWQAQPLP